MSVCTLDKNKVITAFRNEARPLYYSYGANGIIFASTGDILKRSGLSFAVKASMYENFVVDNFKVATYNKLEVIDIEDLQ